MAQQALQVLAGRQAPQVRQVQVVLLELTARLARQGHLVRQDQAGRQAPQVPPGRVGLRVLTALRARRDRPAQQGRQDQVGRLASMALQVHPGLQAQQVHQDPLARQARRVSPAVSRITSARQLPIQIRVMATLNSTMLSLDQ